MIPQKKYRKNKLTERNAYELLMERQFFDRFLLYHDYDTVHSV